ncbi:MAG TPA: hypothetical protein VLT58_00125 [Polyangia bacterium]|nr:hypothetical protein [Polyangia bacterium]
MQRAGDEQQPQTRLTQERAYVGRPRAGGALAGAADLQGRHERAAQARPHGQRNDRARQADISVLDQQADRDARTDEADGAPAAQPAVDGARADPRHRQRVGQAAHPDPKKGEADIAGHDDAEGARPAILREQQRCESQPGAAGDDLQHAVVPLRAIGQPRPPERHGERENRRRGQRRRDLRPGKPKRPQVCGHEGHVHAHRLEHEKVEDFNHGAS